MRVIYQTNKQITNKIITPVVFNFFLTLYRYNYMQIESTLNYQIRFKLSVKIKLRA